MSSTGKTNIEAAALDREPRPASKTPAAPSSSTMAVVAPAVGWLIPGAGHLIQGRWVRGLLLMVSVVAMFSFGVMMQGKLYSFNTGDLLDILGFIGDIGSGALYIVSRALDLGSGAIFRATADYGTKYMIVAGLLNVIAAVDAHQIALGKKQ